MSSTTFESTKAYPSSFTSQVEPVPEPELKKNSTETLSSLSWSQWKEILYKTLNEYEMKLNEKKYILDFKKKYIGNKYPITYIIFGILLLSIIFTIYMLSGIRILSNTIGVIIPFYMSLKALNVDNNNNNNNNNEINKNNNMLWLSYWIIFGIFTLFESISHIFLFWMGNMYELFKIFFYLYLYHPNIKGALFLYRQCLRPFVIQLINYEHTLLHNIRILQKNLSINENDIIVNNNNNINNSNNNNINNNNINNNNNYKVYSMNTNTSANTSKINNNNNNNNNNYTTSTIPIEPSLPITQMSYQPTPIVTTSAMPLNTNINAN